jgi:hypothetical protein
VIAFVDAELEKLYVFGRLLTLASLCEALCEKMVPKSANGWKIDKNMEFRSQAILICCNKSRRLGGSKGLIRNQRAWVSVSSCQFIYMDIINNGRA